jgi:hypothetical protein
MEHAPCNVLCVKLPTDVDQAPHHTPPEVQNLEKNKEIGDQKGDLKKQETPAVASNVFSSTNETFEI